MHIWIHLRLFQRTTTFSWVPSFFPLAWENNVIKCHLLIQPLTTPWLRGIPIMKTNKRLLSRVAYYINVRKDAMVTMGTTPDIFSIVWLYHMPWIHIRMRFIDFIWLLGMHALCIVGWSCQIITRERKEGNVRRHVWQIFLLKHSSHRC